MPPSQFTATTTRDQTGNPHADREQESSSSTAQHAIGQFLTRQPILDTNHTVVGHELQLRKRIPVPVIPGAESFQQMQDEMLLATVIDLDFQQVLGDRMIFLEIAIESLSSQMLEQLPPDRVVVASHISHVDEKLAATWEKLAGQGIMLALDDVAPSPDSEPLIKLARYTRLDITRYDAMTLANLATALDGEGRPQLIARNVDSEEDYAACRRLPFKLLQGWYFTQFAPGATARLDSSRMRVMELLNLVVNHADFSDIEASFKFDAALSYKLLRFINSAAIGLRQEIQSIRHALVMLGHDQLYRWLTLLLFSSGQVDPRNQALLRTALIRAHFIESLGQDRVQKDQRGGLFIVGILSMLDSLLQVPMQQALSTLKLPESVVSALVLREGPYAPYLKLALACEDFDQDTIEACAAEAGLDANTVNIAHVQALIWSEGLDIS